MLPYHLTPFLLQDELSIAARATPQSDTKAVGHIPLRRDGRVRELSRVRVCCAAENFQRKIDGYGE
jgi:hypothetical protein